MNNLDGRKKISKERIKNDLKKLGIKKGDHISVALSFKKIGFIDGGPNVFIDALIETVGSNGTIMMNTFGKSFSFNTLKKGNKKYIYNHKNSPAKTGIVPETFREREQVLRSRHPKTSVSAFGKHAEYLTKDHDENSDAYSPYSKLAKIDGKSLFIGIGDNLVALRHEAQNLAGLFDIVPIRSGVRYVDYDGNIRLFLSNQISACTKKLNILGKKIREKGLLKEGKIGYADAYIGDTKILLDEMTMILKKNPEIFLCDDISCLWCRELERRMDLYNKIKNPLVFQKNSVVKYLVKLSNKLRIKNYRFGNIMIAFIKKLV